MVFELVMEIIHIAHKQPHGMERHIRERVKKCPKYQRTHTGVCQHPKGK